MTYDPNNIFNKMINREIEVPILYEDEYGIVIQDINPAANTHLLIMPKSQSTSFDDFMQTQTPEFVAGFFAIVQKMAAKYNLIDSGYRIITNHGPDAAQSVMHFHIHLLGGELLGPLTHKDRFHK